MEKYLGEFHRHEDVCSQFCAIKSTKKLSEAMKKQLTLQIQEHRESDPTLNSVPAAAKRHHVDEDEMQINSQIAQYLVDELDFDFVKISPQTLL